MIGLIFLVNCNVPINGSVRNHTNILRKKTLDFVRKSIVNVTAENSALLVGEKTSASRVFSQLKG